MPLSDAFDLPDAAALRYWQSKIPITDTELSFVQMQARSRAFAVVGVTRMEIIKTLHQSLEHTLKSGESLDSWRKKARQILKKYPDYRLNNIARTNLQSTYNAGRWAQYEAAGIEYLRYLAILDRRTRPSHAALDDKVYPRNHAFWDAYYPPQGYQCRCTTQAETGASIDLKGRKIESEMPKGLMPDPGFRGNNGKDWLHGLSPAQLDDILTPVPMGPLCKGGKGMFADPSCWIDLEQIDRRHIKRFSEGDLLPNGMDDIRYIKEFMAEFGAEVGKSALIKVPGVNYPLVINDRMFADRSTWTWKVKKNGRERYLKLLARTIKEPFEVWQGLTIMKGRNKAVVLPTLNLIRLWTDGSNKVGGFSAFRLIGGRRWTGVTIFRPKVKREKDLYKYLEKQRKDMFENGVLLYREP